jgi:chitin-binding protein
VAVPGASAGPAGAASEQDRQALLRPASETQDRNALGRQIVVAALIVIVGVSGAAGFMRLRTARAVQRTHRDPEKR